MNTKAYFIGGNKIKSNNDTNDTEDKGITGTSAMKKRRRKGGRTWYYKLLNSSSRTKIGPWKANTSVPHGTLM